MPQTIVTQELAVRAVIGNVNLSNENDLTFAPANIRFIIEAGTGDLVLQKKSGATWSSPIEAGRWPA